MSEHGILDVTPESQAALAAAIRDNIQWVSWQDRARDRRR
jgi:hypothetical protein